ncbi:uncharacterized protein N7496_011238 [Penicillium cataractarum]|uniref:Uncharacterized protein n=1 Tax=Penicillium cataractarum TaxID=2100454 RepID=A0A9W9UXJ0_9EURO|nr:uncharacterized protein N7496_011238 [Penicillium cataractarum]KAJ5358825.1 hypothetical protein N7496_011238 [Penicillium cataractarum]
MPRVADHMAWKWYTSFKSKEDLNLPALTLEPDGLYRIHCNELFCRVPNCPKITPSDTLNNLRKHYAHRHPEIKLTGNSKRGGRPTLAEEHAAIDFHKALYNDHFATPGMTAAVPIKIEDSDSDLDTIKGEDIPWDS